MTAVLGFFAGVWTVLAIEATFATGSMVPHDAGSLVLAWISVAAYGSLAVALSGDPDDS